MTVVGVLVGNPKPTSRTLQAALAIRAALGGTEGPVIDLGEFATELFDYTSVRVERAIEEVRNVDVLVVASPTYKATYTGLLKAFLDRFGAGSLRGKTAVPLLVAASDRHALAVEVHLKPVLVEIGLSVPGPGLFLNESVFATGLDEAVAALLKDAQ
ncbi:NADPH-dependent oxidoreductase [Kibdelosporangium aridum]|uniref:NADPH-dependent oxidoreductase n=1 Tax=Kibdelosporangium aridum TaxID=2030 RepID=A0A428YTL7_KIBAR|nr:NAD(P)H-dependent oxidoreductase [Kibdelosporangium aridum]RSM72816.1 NADPH-dependent oxidoreductase [Kibdelosporangium aridum]